MTLLTARVRAGDERARDDLIAQVYGELRRVADLPMRREDPDHMLLPTAVVHEAVIKLLGEAVLDRAADRSFLFASARAMRQVLVDHTRRRAAAECPVPDALPSGRRHQA